MSDEPSSEQEQQAATPVPRDARGRILPGRSLNPAGRSKGAGALPPFHVVVRRVAESQGVTVEEALQSVTEAAFRRAVAGDVAAQQLILKRLPDSMLEGLAGGGSGMIDLGAGPVPPDDLEGYMRRLDDVSRELGWPAVSELMAKQPAALDHHVHVVAVAVAEADAELDERARELLD